MRIPSSHCSVAVEHGNHRVVSKRQRCEEVFEANCCDTPRHEPKKLATRSSYCAGDQRRPAASGKTTPHKFNGSMCRCWVEFGDFEVSSICDVNNRTRPY